MSSGSRERSPEERKRLNLEFESRNGLPRAGGRKESKGAGPPSALGGADTIHDGTIELLWDLMGDSRNGQASECLLPQAKREVDES